MYMYFLPTILFPHRVRTPPTPTPTIFRIICAIGTLAFGYASLILQLLPASYPQYDSIVWIFLITRIIQGTAPSSLTQRTQCLSKSCIANHYESTLCKHPLQSIYTYIMLGIGAGLASSSCGAISASSFDDRDLALIMAIYEAIIGIAFAIGPAIGSVLFAAGGFEVPFLVIVRLKICVSYISCLLPIPVLDVLMQSLFIFC